MRAKYRSTWQYTLFLHDLKDDVDDDQGPLQITPSYPGVSIWSARGKRCVLRTMGIVV